VGATEDATNRIMDVCDEMSALAGQCTPEISEKLVACTTKIFEACNFQDITGQRITKVVATLKHIDSRIEAIVKAMGEELHRSAANVHNPKNLHAADPEKGLLNGPQLPPPPFPRTTSTNCCRGIGEPPRSALESISLKYA